MAHVVHAAAGAPGRSERAVLLAARHLPGVLVLGAHVVCGASMREVDAILVMPTGLFTIEVKGSAMYGPVHTSANAPWSINGQVADFAGGPNPVRQARGAAQKLRSHLRAAQVDSPFIPAVALLSGDGLQLDPHRVGDVRVARVQDLAVLLLNERLQSIERDTASAVLSALDVVVTEEMLEAFPLSPTPSTTAAAPAPPSGAEASERFAGEAAPAADGAGSSGADATARPNRREQKRARRMDALRERAEKQWRSANRHRAYASAVATVAALWSAWGQSVTSYAFVAALMALVAALQLVRRRALSGPREHGRWAVVMWLWSLMPVAGIGFALTALADVTLQDENAKALWVMLQLLVAMLVAALMLTGRSSFIYPPALVMERIGTDGKPTGAFILVDAVTRKSGRGHHREVEPDDA